MKKRKLTRKKRNQKNKDVKKELVEEIKENSNSVENNQNTERKEFLENLKVTDEDKKSKNIMDRKNAETNDEKRKCEYLKAMNKILEKKDENALEI